MDALKDVLKRYDLWAKKSLGQNFILDTNILNKIARLALAGIKPSVVLEIGAGPGGLTRALLNSGLPVVSVEKDDRCAQALTELKDEYSNFTLIHGDALCFEEKQLGKDICIVANLPYNISTVLLIKWLKEIHLFSRLTLMFQKEVADRLCAQAGDSAYGRLSVLTGWLCGVSVQMILPPCVFTPAPKVTSALVRLEPKKQKTLGVAFSTMEKVTAAAFGQRRKMLRSSLKSLGNPADICAAAGVEPTVRAQDVPVEAFLKMALFVQQEAQNDR